MGRTGCPSTRELNTTLFPRKLFSDSKVVLTNHGPQTFLSTSRWKIFFMQPQTSLLPTQHPLRFLFLLLSPTAQRGKKQSASLSSITKCIHRNLHLAYMQAKQKNNPVKYSANISTDHRYLVIRHEFTAGTLSENSSHSQKNVFLFSNRFCDITPLPVCN